MTFSDFSHDLQRRWSERPGRCLAVLATVHSSHGLGLRLAREYTAEGGAPPPCDLVAWRQVEGIGRYGRPWSSPAGGGAYVTLVRSPVAVPLQLLPLRVAVRLCRLVSTFVGDERCRLKWPNDLVCDSRKLGGILIDVVSRGSEPGIGVVSFGINYDPDLEALGQPGATSLRAEGAPEVGLGEVVRALVAGVDAELAADVPAEETVAAYRALSVHTPGDELVYRSGDEVLRGVFRGIDGHGFLRLDVDGRERRLTAGEVTAHG